MMAAAACTSVLANAGGADVAHEVQGRFHDAVVKPRQNTNNLQTFTGALGGIRADAVSEELNIRRFDALDCPSISRYGLGDFPWRPEGQRNSTAYHDGGYPHPPFFSESGESVG